MYLILGAYHNEFLVVFVGITDGRYCIYDLVSYVQLYESNIEVALLVEWRK